MVYQYDSTGDQYVLSETVPDTYYSMGAWNRAVISENGAFMYRSSWGTGTMFISATGSSSGGRSTGGGSSGGSTGT